MDDTAPVIIEVAVNGMTTKQTNPNVPRSPDEIAADALACLAAGASIVHTHTDDFKSDVDTTVRNYVDAWTPVLSERPDALFYPTFRDMPTVAGRSAHLVALANSGLARLGYVDPGSTNVGGADADGLPTGTTVYVNNYDDCRYAFDECGRLGVGPSISVFEPGFLRVVLAYEAAGRMPRGAMVKFYFGGGHDLYTGKPSAITFGMPPTAACLEAYLDMRSASSIPWAVAVLGGDACASPAASLAVARGGHLRVGLEDFGGPRQPTNVELVSEAVALAASVGRRAATPTETAEMLGLAPVHR